MPQTQISCPRCRKMIAAQVEQLFDVTADPESKKRLLGGGVNRARCPHCGYDGVLATPIVYHDADKEFLLTYFPPELGMPVNDQEKLIGPLITQVMNRLPQEKRKAYLLRPKSFLTYPSLMEHILEGDGISKETLNEQQKRLNVIQRLMQASSPDVRSEIIKQEITLLDESFFTLMSQLFNAAMKSGQQQTAQAFNAMQQQLMDETEFGRKMKAQVGELETAIKTLQDAGEGLTREKLIEIMLEAPNDERLQALISLTRNGLDYAFFQSLTERSEKASGEDKTKLETLRTKVLDVMNELDLKMQEQLGEARAFIEELLKQPNLVEATQQNLDQFDSQIMQEALNVIAQEAQQKNDMEKLGKLQEIVSVLQAASAPPELALIEHMLEHSDDFEKALVEHEQEITPQFVEILANLMMQMDQQQGQKAMSTDDLAMLSKIEALYKAALKWQMKKNVG